jgi:hypothetical protein
MDLKRYGFQALSQIATNPKISEEDGKKAWDKVMDVMERFKDNYEILAKGCLAISKLAKSDEKSASI